MKEIRYVKILKEGKGFHLFDVGEIVIVNSEYEKCYTYYTQTGCLLYKINKSACKEVHIRELDTDIGGEPLECGDEVMLIKDGDEYCKSWYIGGNYWVAYDTDVPKKNTIGYGINNLVKVDKVRKVKPEQKPVDPIEEIELTGTIYLCGIDDGTEGRDFRLKFDAESIEAIAAHMKAKEGKV
jgi:hypothetical protein